MYSTLTVYCIRTTHPKSPQSQHLLDIANCVSLARPLVTYCCERLAALFEMEQRLHKLQILTPKPEPHSQLERVVEANEDDSVFNETPSIKQEPGRPTTPLSKSSESKSRRRSSFSEKKSTAAMAEINRSKDTSGVIPTVSGINNDDEMSTTFFHWCGHHRSVMLELVCIIQIIAIRCPTGCIQVKISSGRGSSGRDGEKVASPLTQLPFSLAELPMPTSLKPDLQKKVSIYYFPQ